MPYVHGVSTISFPARIAQAEVKAVARNLFQPSFPEVDRLLEIFDNTEIVTRNFCKPIEDYQKLDNFKERNDEYVRITLQYAKEAINKCLEETGTRKEDITDVIFVSTTGLSTPSIDSFLINDLRLGQHTRRIPVFGLGCAGGVSGMAKANAMAMAYPDAVVLLVAVELCSLTFLKSDYSKSNFVASSLFSDGIAAAIVKGNTHAQSAKAKVQFVAAESKLYYDSADVMGWEFLDSGFKVIFSHSIPNIINEHVRADLTAFLSRQGLELSDIRNFIFHPGGKKVLSAYEDALAVGGDFLKHTREIMNENGNMSSATVLYVLERFMKKEFQDGFGLMVALGPGFSNEMVLLDMKHA